MDGRANSDVFFLPDEKFDFNVSLSPTCSDSAAGDEDEDEVFVGPISHKEKCVSANLLSQLQSGDPRVSWSPLTGDQLDAMCQEACSLASLLQSGEPRHQALADVTAVPEEAFVQDSKAKLGMLGDTNRVLSPIKRETFCVQDSPMKQLPPAVQRQMLRGSASNVAPATRRRSNAATAPSSHLTAASRLDSSSPLDRAKAPLRSSLRGKPALGVAVVLPNKLPIPPAAGVARAERSRLQPPSKEGRALKRSPSSRRSSRSESCEDLLSDSASVASDVSDSSLNSSLLGKRTLAPPSKSVGLRNVAGVKGPPLQNRRVTERRNTSSSSSSVSSFNSSMSVSPARGKLNSSLNRSQSGSTGPAPCSVGRTASQSKPRRSTASAAAEPAPRIGSRRSLSTRPTRLSERDRTSTSTTTTRSTPLKRPVASPIQPTPTKRLMERSTSIPTSASGRLQSGLKVKTIPEAAVLPTLSAGGKRIQPVDDVSKVLRPKRMMSLSSMDSLPQKPSACPLVPSASSSKVLQMKARRPSALPTPVKRRASAIPSPMSTKPTEAARLAASSDPAPAPTPTPTSARLQYCGPAPKHPREEEPVEGPDIQPFCLEEEEKEEKKEEEEEDKEEPPPSPTLKEQQPDQVGGEDMEAEPSGPEPSTNLMELDTKGEVTGKTQEVLLLDLPAPALQPQEKLLIDLTNTPDLIRTTGKTCTANQLIDLSSPLIRWSPEDKKENAPLINLSF